MCKGSIHQGEIEGGGSQCACVALCFFALPTPQTSNEIDQLLEQGTRFYSSITSNGNYLMIADIPERLNMEGKEYTLTVNESRSGMVSQVSDNAAALNYSIESACDLCFQEADTCLFTIGNAAAGSTIGIKKSDDAYLVCDSHSRDDNGLCISNGKAVVLQFVSLQDLKDMASSLCSHDRQYEMTPIKIAQTISNINSYVGSFTATNQNQPLLQNQIVIQDIANHDHTGLSAIS